MYQIFLQVLFLVLYFTHITYGENNNSISDEIWFTCEFAKKQSPPNDNCAMFDDEGFLVKNDIVYYLRIKNSREKNCKGNKIGHCFKKNKKVIKVKKNKLGKIKFNESYLSVSWLGCKQKYFVSKNKFFYSLIPEKNKCFWATKRVFYISKFNGKIMIEND